MNTVEYNGITHEIEEYKGNKYIYICSGVIKMVKSNNEPYKRVNKQLKEIENEIIDIKEIEENNKTRELNTEENYTKLKELYKDNDQISLEVETINCNDGNLLKNVIVKVGKNFLVSVNGSYNSNSVKFEYDVKDINELLNSENLEKNETVKNNSKTIEEKLHTLISNESEEDIEFIMSNIINLYYDNEKYEILESLENGYFCYYLDGENLKDLYLNGDNSHPDNYSSVYKIKNRYFAYKDRAVTEVTDIRSSSEILANVEDNIKLINDKYDLDVRIETESFNDWIYIDTHVKKMNIFSELEDLENLVTETIEEIKNEIKEMEINEFNELVEELEYNEETEVLENLINIKNNNKTDKKITLKLLDYIIL